MKQYFAKWLPVKEHFWYVGANIREKASGNIGIVKKVGEGLNETEYEHVKLFLCSRDIQVGNTLRYAMAPENEHPYEDGCKEEGCFKVIGEISPEATWVKDGDEFDEDELRLIVDDGTEHNPPITSALPAKRIEIKGLCGHFH